MAGPDETLFGLADEGPGYHPADVVRREQLARQLAQLVQALEAEGLSSWAAIWKTESAEV